MMDGRQLGHRILQAIDALPEEERGNRRRVFESMGEAIVQYLQEQAEVLLADLLLQALSQAAVTPQDGGATLKTSLLAFLQAQPQRRRIR